MKKTLPFLVALLALAAVAFYATFAQADSPSGTDAEAVCNSCHARGNLTMDFPSGETIPLEVAPATLTASVHSGLTCTGCHQALQAFPHPQTSAASAREYQVSQAAVCRTCHAAPAKAMEQSIHGQASLGDSAATCVDCHGAHDVVKPTGDAFRLGSIAVCAGCHENSELMDQYGVVTNVVSTYREDFHGKTATLLLKQGGGAPADVAVCADCHGAHNIKAADAPDSLVSADNLPQTCASCHEGAGAGFTSASLVHREPSLDELPMVLLARWFYRFMIPFVLMGLLIHVLIDVRRGKLARKES